MIQHLPKNKSRRKPRCSRKMRQKNRDNARMSIFSPIKFVRFPSMLGDEKREKSSLFKEENVIKVRDDDKLFEITMDTSQYKPDELKVNVEQNNLTVEAKHTEQSEDG